MKIRLENAADLGPLVKAVRKHQGLRQDATAEGIGVSENFLSKIERGGTTVQWDKLFTVLDELGLHVEIDVPDAALSPAGKRHQPAGRTRDTPATK
ncbi:helix-turn-helix domain-containing protein [Stenotrophomonas sp. SAU14A_NAIMI4_8]|uniref:helix-turn-helix domain-containing protein n=1 Tax=Stenotrophomonas TaxID=40323 RepID=UPI000D542C20|nr:helix-turn-helix domain-containing protein [Stenotrophomonas sp. SAU14A_NAIMI4_8]AWH31537.1 transcriptional regulator [Stenotrophomonas sp. SAU14A_NAIMI4_8]